MIAIDTNVLVRYFTRDNLEQAELAKTLIEKYSGSARSIFINNIVICELLWVLARSYKYTKVRIVTILHSILSTKEFAFENYDLLQGALKEYESKKFNFPDALIAQINKSHNVETTISFDKAAVNTALFSDVNV